MRFTIERSVSFIQEILHSCNLIHTVLHSGSLYRKFYISNLVHTVLHSGRLYRKFDSF